jgi:aspartyl aminopeptidase
MPYARLEFINAAWTPYHAVEEASKRLMAAGFTHIAEKDAWNLQPGVWGPAAVWDRSWQLIQQTHRHACPQHGCTFTPMGPESYGQA